MARFGPVWPGAARCGLAWLGPASLSAERAGATAPRGGQKEPERGRPLLALIWGGGGGGTIMPAPKEGGEAPWEGGSCGWRPAAGQGQRAGQGEGAVTAPQPPKGPPRPAGVSVLCYPKSVTSAPALGDTATGMGTTPWGGFGVRDPSPITITLSPHSLASFRGPQAPPVLVSHGCGGLGALLRVLDGPSHAPFQLLEPSGTGWCG